MRLRKALILGDLNGDSDDVVDEGVEELKCCSSGKKTKKIPIP